MRDIAQIMEEKGEQLKEFQSALSEDWQTVLFKAIDILHSLQLEAEIPTAGIKNKLLPLISKGLKEDTINEAINTVNNLSNSIDNLFILRKMNEVLSYLFAVKISLKKEVLK